MAGGFDKNARPKRAGSYFNFIAELPVAVRPNPGNIVAVPVIADWGPDNEAVLLTEFSEWEAIYGDGDTAGRRAVLGAFLGEGISGKGGAGGVIAFRMAASSADFAELTLNNTSAAPTLVLTARYKGTKGNGFAATVQAGAVAGTKELLLLEDGIVRETYVHTDTDITDLADLINRDSGMVTAADSATGTALANVSAQALTGGADGSTLTGTEWAAMLDALEFEAFSVLAPYDLTDSGISTSLRAWIAEVRERGKRVRVVLGGPAAESFSTHRARAVGYDDPDVIAFGTGTIATTEYSTTGAEVNISTSQGGPRVAGAMARRGEKADLVLARFAGWRIVAGATLDESTQAIDLGMTVLSRDGHAEGPVHINTGVTSYQGGDVTRPKAIYSNVKFVATEHGIQRDVTTDQESGDLIGEIGVNDRARDLVVGRAQEIMQGREDNGIIHPGWTVELDNDPPPTIYDQFVQLKIGIVPVPGLRQVFNTIRVGTQGD